MRLHQDKNAFQAIIDGIAGSRDLRFRAMLEKDYYVTLLLYELASNPKRQNVYFKGGTALYKALKSIRRFSEDIDLSIDASTFDSGNKRKRFVKEVALGFKSLSSVEPSEDDIKGNIASGRYYYDPIYKLTNDPLNRIGHVRVEVNSFSVVVPNNELVVAPHLYELSDIETKKILEDKYGVKPFKIRTMTIERIFVDKLFAIEYYYLKKKYLDVAKHVYDITVLYNLSDIQNFVCNKTFLKQTINYKINEEMNRKEIVFDSNTRINNFTYFNDLSNDKNFAKSYIQMLNEYVFEDNSRISIKKVLYTLSKLNKYL